MKALVIPEYQPSGALLHLLQTLPVDLFAAIIIVDDGSGPGYAEIFAQAAAIPNVRIARHAVAVGRGAAIRTGINAALSAAPNLTAIVTAGSHHSAAAIERISGDSGALVLGTNLSRGVLTASATRALVGVPLSEPGSTLRSIPAALFPHLLRMESRDAEFEIEMLIVADEHSIPIVEQTSEAHSRPAKSPVRAAGVLLRFAAIQRPYRSAGFAFALLTAALLLVVTIAEIHGFTAGHLFSQPIWQPWGQRRLLHFAVFFAAISLPLLLLIPWGYASVFAALTAAATLLATGPRAVIALIFFLASACALGSKLLGKAEPRRAEAHLSATLLGIAIYSFAMTLTARIPVNYSAGWAVVLAIPILLDARGALRRFRQLAAMLRSFNLRNWPERAAFALLAFILCIHWFAALEPETSADGLAMHLAIAANIAAHHAMTYQPNVFLWSVMPMAADFSYALIYLLGGEAAVSLFNFALLLSIAALIYSVSRRWLPRASALVVTALFASTPLVHLVTGSLFIENFIGAMILAMLAALWRFRETGQRKLLYAAAMLAGAAAAAKLGACVFALMAAPTAIIAVRREWKHLGRRPAVTAALAIALFLTVAAPPYMIAYAKTGNPVFPFLNETFRSPLLEPGVEFRDSRFHQALAWKTPFNLTFHTGEYFESQNGAFGFQYLLLIPLALVALLAMKHYAVRSAAFVGLAAGALIMATQPNGRYVYATLPLLTVTFGALVARFASQQRWLTRALLAAAVVCIGLNVYFEAASGWYHRHFYSASIFRPTGRAQYLREMAPMRDVTQRFRRAEPQAPVLLVTENDLADAGDHVFEYEWHQYSVRKRIAAAATASDLQQIFMDLGIRYFIAHRQGPDEDRVATFSMGEYLANCTTAEFENGRFYVARMTAECESLNGADLEAKLENAPPALVSPGVYDDFDLALKFRGHWTRSTDFSGPYRHSISYTDLPGSRAVFAFEGQSLTYVYTKAFNRGIAQLEIDGVAHSIDLYSPVIQWQSKTQFCCLNRGRHSVVLRVTGEKQIQAQGAYVDLDGFIVR